jgi:hypothetical protein
MNNNRMNTSTALRSKKGPAQNRKTKVTTGNDRVLVRKFILNERVSLNSNVGTNTILERTFQWDGDELQGFNAISAGFDQYRIRKIQVFASSCAADITQIQIASSIAKQPIFANASTTIYSAVDLTGGPNPGADIQAFQNCEFRIPDPFKATKLADFVPRLAQQDGLLYTPNTWVSTSNTTKLWNGLHTRFVNSEGTNVFPSPSSQQEFNIRSVVHVEFRHPIFDQTTLFLQLQRGTGPLVQPVKARRNHDEEDLPETDKTSLSTKQLPSRL